jgi:hypothetical protein
LRKVRLEQLKVAVELDAQRDGHVRILVGGDCDDGCVGDRACVTGMLNEAFQVTQRRGVTCPGRSSSTREIARPA